MGAMDKFFGIMSMNNENDDDEFDEFDEGFAEEPVRKPARVKEDDSESEDKPARKPVRSINPLRSNNSRRGAVMSNESMEVCVCKPTVYEDATQIADALLANKSVVLNLEGIDMNLALRIFDFATGACYALQGRLEAIAKYVYVITPESIGISGDTSSDGQVTLSKGFAD